MKNPVLKGFHPDPSAIRLGKYYYVACSTFEWFPGVVIYRSTDLVHWELASRPLDRLELLDIKGVPDSCGVWAPCLSYDGTLFHLVYTQVRSFDGVWKDTPNYLTTSESIEGPWSSPIYLGSHGFDGSIFHDEDGKKWYVSMEVDHRKEKFFGGIIMQEYDPVSKTLIGETYRIFEGTALGKTEGPHIYKKDGYYYLLTAEGGTEYGHAATIARSKDIKGPYEVSPQHPLITAALHPEHPLQKTGHADLVQRPEGDWVIFYLTGRPDLTHGRCILGREMGIELIDWPEGEWPSLKHGSTLPRELIEELPELEEGHVEEYIDFGMMDLPPSYHSLRIPINASWAQHEVDAGILEVKGRESLNSLFEQSLIARRLQSLHASYQAVFDFDPNNFQQMAGIVAYYNTAHYFYLHIMGDEDGQSRYLSLTRCDNYAYTELIQDPILIGNGRIKLKLQWEETRISFAYSIGQEDWISIPGVYDGSILSDDYVRDGSTRYRPAFTGTFVGFACQDLSGQGKSAKVRQLLYEEMNA